jgi:glycyl-tRNA synthetase
MLEISCTNIVLSDVLKTSVSFLTFDFSCLNTLFLTYAFLQGHVDKFADFMVKDVKNGQFYRADKLVEEQITKIMNKKKNLSEADKQKYERIILDCENYGVEELNACITDNKLMAPDTGNALSEATPFNLMFSTQIGPSGYLSGYLRPETAQGIFLNFKRLIEFNNGRMPCAGAQIGIAFRNEIHPKQGMLRVREFSMAEIEHFVDPLDKSHPKFNEIAELTVPLWSADAQEVNGPTVKDTTLGQASEKGLISNQTLCYFMARTYKFLLSVGIKQECVRFRQHRSNEMAHYAQDCWDAEVETSYGWIEVAGHSDRSCYDLTKHSEKTGIELVASRPLKEARKVDVIQVTLDKKKVGKAFKGDSKPINEYVDKLTEEEKFSLFEKMEADKKITLDIGAGIELTDEYIVIEKKQKTIIEEKYVPHVIEPSYGIGRIIYCVFEHCFKVRPQDAQRTYFDFPIAVAPVKCSLLPLMS